MTDTQYEIFAYVAGGVCLLGWIVMLSQLGSLVRRRASFKNRMGALGYALLWATALLIIATRHPAGTYKGEEFVFGVVLAVMGSFGYLIGRYTNV